MDREEQFKFTCIRCGNCCTDKTTLVNVTYLDILRIKDGLDLNLEEVLEVIGFYILTPERTENDTKKMVLSPIETEKGPAYLGLIKNSKGICLFYDEKMEKCSIYNLRPIFCRTFPFSFSYKNQDSLKIFYTEKAKKYCLGISADAPIIDFNYWGNLGKKALDALNKNHSLIKNWNDNVRNKKINPTVKNFLNRLFTFSEKYH